MNPTRILLYTALLTVSPFAAFAQKPQSRVVTNTISGLEPARQAPDMKHFNLDFPGGTPGALAAAISKATGVHLNLIIPVAYADTRIMPVKVEGVTVPDLFSAIGMASQRQMPVVTGTSANFGPAQKGIVYKSVSISFQTQSAPITDESVWSFTSTGPTKEEEEILGAANAVQPVCRYFQLAPYLLDHSVEDITTAIQTGWKLLKVDPVPQLSFHEETKLLIAVGSEPYIEQIPRVLQQLMLDGDSSMMRIAAMQYQLAEILLKGGPESKAQELREKIEQFYVERVKKERAK